MNLPSSWLLFGSIRRIVCDPAREVELRETVRDAEDRLAVGDVTNPTHRACTRRISRASSLPGAKVPTASGSSSVPLSLDVVSPARGLLYDSRCEARVGHRRAEVVPRVAQATGTFTLWGGRQSAPATPSARAISTWLAV